MAIRYAANATELTTRLGESSGGDTIILSDGSYGSYTFSQTFASDVTVIAENALGAVFEWTIFNNASHIVFDGMRVNWEGHSSMFIQGSSSYITVRNCEIGEASGYGSNEAYYGIHCPSGNIDNIVIDNNYIRHVQNCIVLFQYATNVTITNNIFDYYGADAIKMEGTINGLVENNFVGAPGVGYHSRTAAQAPGAHPDFAQGGSGTTNITFRGNVMLPAADSPDTRMEGIFGDWNSCLIELNVFASSSIEMIDVNSNCTIQYNTLVYVNGQSDNYYHNDIILAGTGNTSNYNVYTQTDGSQGPLGTNIRIQTTNSGGSYFDEDQFVNFTGQYGVQIEDLLPAEGADIGTLGAYDRIVELAGLTTPTKPALAGGQVLLINGLPLLGS